MKRSSRKKVYRMEVEDDLGIKRGVKSKFNVSLKAYVIMKLCLIVSLPLLYFLYSPLLVVGVLAYFLFIIITKKVEKSLNNGLKKDLRTHLPKADSILCILLVIIAVTGIIVGQVSTNQKKSPFENMTMPEIEIDIKDFDFDKSDMKKREIKSILKNFGSLMTGTRILFEEEKTFGGFGGFGGPMGDMEGFTPPDGFEPPADFKKPDINEMLGNMPFNVLFQSIIKAVCSAMILIICLAGILSFIKIKKAFK